MQKEVEEVKRLNEIIKQKRKEFQRALERQWCLEHDIIMQRRKEKKLRGFWDAL